MKTFRENFKNLHYIAPEYELSGPSGTIVTPAVDIYAFGMCALEIAVPHILYANGTSTAAVDPEGKDAKEKPAPAMTQIITPEKVQAAIQALDDPLQRVIYKLIS